jgi:Aldehyde:ferredoxin oxidoreductase
MPFPESDPPHPPLNKEYFEACKTEYYKLMGWDVETGLPTRSSLKKLGMDDVLASFETRAFRLPD